MKRRIDHWELCVKIEWRELYFKFISKEEGLAFLLDFELHFNGDGDEIKEPNYRFYPVFEDNDGGNE